MAADYLAILRRSHAQDSAPTQDDGRADAGIDLAALDAERNEADRLAGRGFDHDLSAPSHSEFVERQEETAKAIGRHCEATGTDLVDYLERFGFRLIDDLEGSR
jgi:hypothetical protein